MAAQEIKVPDIGDFDAVEVIEVLVAKGDTVDVEQPLITLESDKATLEVPTTVAGTIAELRVKEGDQVSEGDVIALLEAGDAESEDAQSGDTDESSNAADEIDHTAEEAADDGADEASREEAERASAEPSSEDAGGSEQDIK